MSVVSQPDRKRQVAAEIDLCQLRAEQTKIIRVGELVRDSRPIGCQPQVDLFGPTDAVRINEELAIVQIAHPQVAGVDNYGRAAQNLDLKSVEGLLHPPKEVRDRR